MRINAVTAAGAAVAVGFGHAWAPPPWDIAAIAAAVVLGGIAVLFAAVAWRTRDGLPEP
jgi:hypothetical protein